MTRLIAPPRAMKAAAPSAAVESRGRKCATKATVPTEHKEQSMLFAWAWLARGAFPALVDMYAIPNAGGYTGGFRQNGARVQSMKREGVRSGVPDICLPHARGSYHALYIELKRRDATPSDTKPAQRDWHDRLRAAGNCVRVCAGWEEALDEIVAYLEITPIED